MFSKARESFFILIMVSFENRKYQKKFIRKDKTPFLYPWGQIQYIKKVIKLVYSGGDCRNIY